MNHAFGRYSDTVKSQLQLEAWKRAETLYASGDYLQAWHAFFEYLRDPTVDNVHWDHRDDAVHFRIYQGSRTVTGRAYANGIEASAPVARLIHQSVAVMRKLLEINYALNYSRFALSTDDLVTIRFEAPVAGGQPAKLYHALRELALNADYYDDPLMEEFSALERVDGGRILRYGESESKTLREYFIRWITAALDDADRLDAEKQVGAISWILLAAANRIDYLLVPQGGTIPMLRKLVSLYFAPGDRTYVERNAEMSALFRMLLADADQRVERDFYGVTSTFASTGQSTPEGLLSILNDAIVGYNHWRSLDNQAPAMACLEYAAAHPLAAMQLPSRVAEALSLMMEVLHAHFYRMVGRGGELVDPATGVVDRTRVEERIRNLYDQPQGGMAGFELDVDNLSFTSPIAFAASLVTELHGRLKAYVGT